MSWVNTDVAITGHVISKNEPKNSEEGIVWIYNDNAGSVNFYKLKYSDIGIDEVYPISAKQYVGGAWVDVEAKSFQNGVWVDWIKYLYSLGDKYESVTGGWDEVKAGTSTITWNDDGVELKTLHSSARYCTTYTKNAINIDCCSTLYAVVSNLSFASGGSVGIGLMKTPYSSNSADSTNFFAASIQITSTTSNNKLLEVPISELKGTGSYYIQIASRLADVMVHEIYVK
jgi:hypothetical protein